MSRFLLRRALDEVDTVGHAFFWILRAEVKLLGSDGVPEPQKQRRRSQVLQVTSYDSVVKCRFRILTDMFEHCCGAYRTDLGHQVRQVNRSSHSVLNTVRWLVRYL